jgi:hypothetical protein
MPSLSHVTPTSLMPTVERDILSVIYNLLSQKVNPGKSLGHDVAFKMLPSLAQIYGKRKIENYVWHVACRQKASNAVETK